MDWILSPDGWLTKALEFDKLAHAGGSCLALCVLVALWRFNDARLYALWCRSDGSFWRRAETLGCNWRFLDRRQHNVRLVRAALLVLFCGVVLEFVQFRLGVHEVSLYDVAANLVGCVAFWLAVRRW